MRIWKWTLGVIDNQSIEMPVFSKILTVQVQHGEPQIWALCDESCCIKKTRHFKIFGTGNPVPYDPLMLYISTFQLAGGNLVFHVFEVVEPEYRGD